MLRSLVALFILVLPAAAEDWNDVCRALGSESTGERDAAFDRLRRAGPDAATAIDAAAKGDGPAAAEAAAVRTARKWDPESRISNIDLLVGLDAPGDAEREEALNRVAALGSWVAGPLMNRVLHGENLADRLAALRSLAAAAPRDPGWAREASRWLDDHDALARPVAIQALVRHAGRSQRGDLRLALARESDPASRQILWQAIVGLANSVEDLPPFPESADDYAGVLAAMVSGPGVAIRRAAWDEIQRRTPIRIPPPFWDDSARLLSLLGRDEFERKISGVRWLRRPPVGVRLRLSLSAVPDIRRTATATEELAPAEIVTVTSLLSDPEFSVRADALRSLERWDYRSRTEPVPDRIAAWIRFGDANRAWLDFATGAGEPGEALAAARPLVESARNSGVAALVAYQALQLSPAAAVDALAILEKDKDLGTAAKRLRMLLQHATAASGLGFGRGLDDPQSVRWAGGAVDIEIWKRLASSEDMEEKRLAAQLSPGAWDNLAARAETAPVLRGLAADNDAQVSQVATSLLVRSAPEFLPERETLNARDYWVRPRTAVLAQLRAAFAPGAVIDRSRMGLLNSAGNLSLLVSLLRSGRPDEVMNVDQWMITRGEPAIAPVLLARAADMDRPMNVTWFSALAAASPQGTRCVVAFARQAAPALRVDALQALIATPWADEYSEEAVVQACSPGDKEGRIAILAAIRTGWRSRAPLTSRAADAVTALLLRLEEEDDGAEALEAVLPSLGETLALASAEWKARLGRSRKMASMAARLGVDLGIAPMTIERALLGGPGERQRAIMRLPAERLETIRLVALSWLAQGRGGDVSEAWILNRAPGPASVALLAWAAEDPDARQSLLELRAQVLRWNRSPTVASKSLRVADAEAPAEYLGPSELARSRVGGNVNLGRSPALFASLCAAAFRGGAGDDLALARVATLLGPEKLPDLAPLLASRIPACRLLAAQITGRVGIAAPGFAVAALRASLAEESSAAARAAKLAALARLGDAKGLDAIRALAASALPEDRLAAAVALGVTPTRDATAILARLARDEDFPVRDAAETALRSLTRRVSSREEAPWKMRDWEGWLAANPDVELKDPMLP